MQPPDGASPDATAATPAPKAGEAAITELMELMGGKMKSLEKVLQNLRADNQALKQKVAALEAKVKTAEQKLEAKTHEVAQAQEKLAVRQQAPHAVMEIVKNSNLTLNSLTAEQSAELKNQVAHLIKEIDACLQHLND
jgi:chromosome segregation ATPase